MLFPYFEDFSVEMLICEVMNNCHYEKDKKQEPEYNRGMKKRCILVEFLNHLGRVMSFENFVFGVEVI